MCVYQEYICIYLYIMIYVYLFCPLNSPNLSNARSTKVLTLCISCRFSSIPKHSSKNPAIFLWVVLWFSYVFLIFLWVFHVSCMYSIKIPWQGAPAVSSDSKGSKCRRRHGAKSEKHSTGWWLTKPL